MPERCAEDLKTARRNRNSTRELAEKGWYHSMRFPDGRVIPGIHTLEGLQTRVSRFPIPQDLTGKRVLDIGAWDGWFSFEMERRGAEVMAIDCVEIENFRYAHRQLGSKVDYREMDVYELTPDRIGRFDIVLCLGVLYHLKHPLLALERICDLTTDLAIIESFVADDIHTHTEFPWMEFYEIDELGGQLDNWFGPNVECLVALCRTAGFARAQLLETSDHNASVACFRHWEKGGEVTQTAPLITAVAHSQNNGINFYSSRDEYLTCWFMTSEKGLIRDNVHPQVSDWGVQPVYVRELGDEAWQVNFKLPPGLGAGWHPVRLRTASSAFSDPLRIAVDMRPVAGDFRVQNVCDGISWKTNEVRLGDSSYLTFWVSGLSENADFNNLRAYLGHKRLVLEYLAAQPDPNGLRQVNARVPNALEAGHNTFVVKFAGVVSEAIEVNVMKA
jgi:tRNA (mo5U34)-methyltransferase